MSQIIKNSVSGIIPPVVPTSFVTDNGTAISVLNILNVNGGSTTVSNDNGIITEANPNLSDNLEIFLTNRLFGMVTADGTTTQSLITVPLADTPSVYRFQFDVTGRETTTGDGVGYTVFASARTDGTNATIISDPFLDEDEDTSLIKAFIQFISSGNDVILLVTGVFGQTITYKAVGTYVVV